MISILKIFQIQSPSNKFTINITCSRPHCSPIYSLPLNRQVDYTLCLFSLAPNWTKKPGCLCIYNLGAGQKNMCSYMYNFGVGQKKPGCTCTMGTPQFGTLAEWAILINRSAEMLYFLPLFKFLELLGTQVGTRYSFKNQGM